MGPFVIGDVTVFSIPVACSTCHCPFNEDDEVCKYCGGNYAALHVNGGLRVEDHEGRTLRFFIDGTIVPQLLSLPLGGS